MTERTGVVVSNLYSGHGTYSTLGLAHSDQRVREHFLQNWLFPMVDTATDLGAGLGFFCHAFSEEMLRNQKNYQIAMNNLYQGICEVSKYAKDKKLHFICTEQMYSPHQIPWTINMAERFIRDIYEKSKAPMYITVDTGHACGQKSFLKPTRKDVNAYIERRKRNIYQPSLFVGAVDVYDEIDRIVSDPTIDNSSATEMIMNKMDQCNYMFAQANDGDPYQWLIRHACYSPVIHLQQTDGTFSKHLPFTKEYNSSGIIRGDRLLKAIEKSYMSFPVDGMPPKCDKIFLTLEVFSGTTEKNVDIVRKIKESVDYWRQYIPKDGLSLDVLLARLG